LSGSVEAVPSKATACPAIPESEAGAPGTGMWPATYAWYVEKDGFGV
jgi:hypothetical protein